MQGILKRIAEADPTHLSTSSTKIEALLEAVCEMRRREPAAKAICFSQFVNALDLIEYRLQETGHPTAGFVGKLTHSSRLLSVLSPCCVSIVIIYLSRCLRPRTELGTKVGVIKLDGRMSVDQRDRALSAFQGDSSYQLLLMSLKAGGVALNLTAANHVYLMDRAHSNTSFVYRDQECDLREAPSSSLVTSRDFFATLFDTH